ncbi:beta-galactosidase [Tateyamaria sp. ANG-S1]|uniref:beta-galactosidase n=1 Tax=Tateyamaria sp. ANG-S1 TaxID=1577905 RepID=UPI0005802EA3|nr:beta-galactosidase [Tateyamaria sp. ANG-S1]KIC51125.1 beta-galactosidase [Tateyamaria sp. ANG-S1]
MKRTLGVCYYPEHWPETQWEEDARRMADLGLTWVRIGEFAWKRMEPREGEYDWGWLDRAIETLGAAGLKVVLGTPTATPPKWVCKKHPDMFAVDENGHVRGYGSRRHYCFSHQGFLEECRKIVRAVAERYGRNPHVAAWQTDNEYGCHDTVISYSDAARTRFQDWLRGQFPGQGNDGDIGALNAAWGNVFWSMDYGDFDEIGLPNLTVTEPNPAHVHAFRRFSSDQVVLFNRAQVEIIRQFSDAPIAHNYMGRVTEFDHFKVGDDLEIASWDSYPLGFLEDRVGADPAHQRAYAQQGDPDFQAFHHDLYRAVGKGRWWIMEQQPGPVNWAPYNPSPLPGMVRLWSWEAFAHGAEAVCYFRWRQAPFAQEQMHAGLLRPDSVEAEAFGEAAEVMAELADAPDVSPAQAPVALLFDYDADWAWSVQPHGEGLSYFGLVFDWYRACRKLGLSVDILRPDTRDFAGYALVLAPCMMHMPDDLKATLQAVDAEVVLGPRSGARDADFNIPTPLPPAWPGSDLAVSRVQSMRPDLPVPMDGGGFVSRYLEQLEGGGAVVMRTDEGAPVAVRCAPHVTYMGGWGDDAVHMRLIKTLLPGLETERMPEGVRRRDTGTERFWFNYSDRPVQVEGQELPAAGVLRVAR